MRKSFIVHNDSLGVLDDLNDEQCGELFRAIKAYQQGREISLSPIVRIAFSPFKNQFDRDLIKYEKTCIARADAGSKGGKQKVANASKRKQKVANVADSDSKSKSDSDSDKYSDDDYSLSVAIYESICIVAPHTKKPNQEKWADTIRLMREVDNIPHHTIQQVFSWANQDDFWKTNILSLSKLRKQFPQLQAKMVTTNDQKNQSGRNPGANRLSAVERVRAKSEENRAARADNRHNMENTGGDLRQHDSVGFRGRDAGGMDSVIEGDYTQSDS